MKKTVKLIGHLIISFFLVQCMFVGNKTTVVFENKSDLQVDSVLFTINKYKCKITKVGPAERGAKEIPKDSIDTNNHDVMVTGSIFVNGKLAKSQYDYNDLSGSLNDTYTLTLNRDLTVSLR
jgi:hypothetical protein